MSRSTDRRTMLVIWCLTAAALFGSLGPLAIAGRLYLLLTAKHGHAHCHDPLVHTHNHRHDDAHHRHTHEH